MDGLSSICAGLGSLEEDDDGNITGYTKGEYCSDNVKDLLRFLRRDDPEKRDVFKQVCKWNIVGKDVLPIIEYYQEDRNLVLNAVKILVFLTMPVEPTSFDIAQQIEYLWELKAAITMSSAVPVIVSLLESPLENLENECFTDDDWKLVQLVLTLFRNILAIQDILPHQQTAGGSATQFLYLRDRFLELLFKENVMDLILVLSQHTGGDSHGYLRQDNILLLEIFYYIFKGQDPEMIVKSYLKGSKVGEDTENLITSLQAITQEENEKRKLTRIRNISRHSQFSGTFTRVALDGSKALFKGNPSASGDDLLKSHKKQRGRSKRITWDQGEKPSTRCQTLELFYGFITQFLVGGYNALMQSILEDIEKDQEQIQSSDIVIFFYVAQFVMSFQYHKCLTSKQPSIDADKESVTQNDDDDDTLFSGSICGPVSETLNESMFKMVISKWHYAFEALKQTHDYKFLSAAGSVVKVMIRMLDLVLNQAPEDSKEPQTARVLLYKLFYDQTEEGMVRFILNLIKSFDTNKQSKSDLAELVESMHVILRLIESLQARGTLRVSKKFRKKKKKRTMTNSEHVKEIGGSTSVDNNTTTHNVVGDSCADVNLSEKEISTNQEFDESLKDSVIFDRPVVKAAKLASNDEPDVITDDVARAYLGSDNSSGDDEQPLLTDEVDFKVSSLVSALANNTIIHNLCWLLKFYKSNSFTTNHYIICMFRRICDDLELSPMLYQLSHLIIFYEILNEQKLRPSKDYENIVTFLKSLVRKMLRKMKSYPLLLVEVLFPKTRQECHYINCGYMINDLKSMRSGRGSGGRDFSEGDTWAPRSVADALGDDDFEDFQKDDQENDYPGDGKESTESISNDESDGIIKDRTGHISEDGPDITLELTLNDEMQGRLKDLYEKYKNDPDFAELIARDLDQNGDISKLHVSKALKQLGVKIPAKRKLHKSGVSKRISNDEVSMANSQKTLKESKHPNRGVNVFTVDQEQKIRDLFMQFHEQKRCSHMIAKELDSTGKISANIISRKLKQLGLVVPKKKGAGVNKVSPEIAGESDEDTTLLSLRKRRKHKGNGIDTAKKINQKIARKSPEDMSDDEPLSALVKSKKKARRSEDDELMVDSTERNPAESTQVSASDEYIQVNEINGAFEEETPIVSHSSDTETQTMRRDSPPNASSEEEAVNSEHEPVFDELADHRQTQTMRLDSPPNASSNEVVSTEHEPVFDDDLADEIADFDENRNDTSTTTTEKISVSRRRLRMVMDFDDDE